MYPTPAQLALPLTPYAVTGYRFRQRLRRRVLLWATHLGEDIGAAPGTPVSAVGEGQVVWAETRRGTPQHRNWGGIIVLGHTHTHTQQPFFTLYGHLTNLQISERQTVAAGQPLGAVAPGATPENGWWLTPHLHFAIYTGPWREQILPGYKRPEQWRTRLAWWQDPRSFIEAYNNSA